MSVNELKNDSTQLFVAILKDISIIKRAEQTVSDNIKLMDKVEYLENYVEELQILNRDLEQFTYASAHDLQEPLRMISRFLQLLERRYKDELDEKARQYIHFAVDGGKQMQSLLTDLLTYATLKDEDIKYEQIEMVELIETVLSLLQLKIENNRVNVSYTDLPSIFAHKSSLQLVFQNLIDNAIKYKKEGTPLEIKIQVESRIDEWEFSVSDNGIGIEEHYHKKMFRAFQRLHNRSEYEGTGMGLVICKRIVENHKGEIWLESKLGEGTTFHFTISKLLN